MKRRLSLVAQLTLLLCLFQPAASLRGATDELLTIGSPAPAIDVEHWLSLGNGRFQKVSTFEKGKVYIIEFWATWCGPCIASMPHLVEVQKQYADRGVQLISISNEELELVQQFLEKPVFGSDDDQQTYAKLTSAYCLTTDPDGSVYEDYMEASGQNGIPTAFIVGKDGVIEWIGHPMRMDQPLAQIVEGSWDREAAREALLATKRIELIRNRIGQAMRTGDIDRALDVIDEALKQYADNPEVVEFLSQTRIRVQVFPATRLAMEGKTDEALALLDELKQANPDHQTEIIEVQLSVLLHGERFDDAAIVLDKIAGQETNAVKLNQISWMIYEAAADNQDFSNKLLAAATAAALKATQLAPDQGAVHDTYAHLLHRIGKLDQALQAQTLALEHAGEAREEIAAFLEQLQKEKQASATSN